MIGSGLDSEKPVTNGSAVSWSATVALARRDCEKTRSRIMHNVTVHARRAANPADGVRAAAARAARVQKWLASASSCLFVRLFRLASVENYWRSASCSAACTLSIHAHNICRNPMPPPGAAIYVLRPLLSALPIISQPRMRLRSAEPITESGKAAATRRTDGSRNPFCPSEPPINSHSKNANADDNRCTGKTVWLAVARQQLRRR